MFAWYDRLTAMLAQLAAWMFVATGMMLVYEVVARHLFNAPTIWAHGMTQRIFAAYYFICGAYISLHKSHINMDLIYNRFSDRGKAVLDIVS